MRQARAVTSLSDSEAGLRPTGPSSGNLYEPLYQALTGLG